MKISIVTISFNQAEYLRECIESVLAQSSVDLEYIIVDPGSTDGSREIIQSYGDKVVSLFETDMGPADGLNKGFARATGDILGYLNSDDVLYEGSLDFVIEFFEAHQAIDIVSGAGDFIDSNGKNIGKITPSRFSNWMYARNAVTMFQQGSFFRAGVFNVVGGFNKDNRICWDGEFFVDAYAVGAKFAVVSKRLAGFRIYGLNISSGKSYRSRLAVEHSRIFEKIIGRKRNFMDRWLDFLARLIKLCDLDYLCRRLREGNLLRPPNLDDM